MQEDGNSILHCQGKSTIRNSKCSAATSIIFVKKVSCIIVLDLNMFAYFSQIVHKKTASVLCLTTVKNEDKMDFSKILEAIKVSI